MFKSAHFGPTRVCTLALTLLAATAAPAADALGRKHFPIDDVERVHWNAVGQLIVTQGATESLEVEAEDRLLSKIKVEQNAGTLSLGFREGQFVTSLPIRFRLTVRTLSALESTSSGELAIEAMRTPSLSVRLGGSGSLRITHLAADNLSVTVPGSSNVTVDGGEVQSQRIEIAGSGNYAALGLASESALVSITGSADVELSVARRLTAKIAGSGNIRYRGEPALAQEIDGAGEIRRIGAR